MKIKNFGKTEDRIVDLVLPIADELGYDLWDVCFEKEGSVRYLRIYIDKEDGITIDDAEKMTRPVNEILDREDPIKESYILEVGSPGIERKLWRGYQFEASLGMEVVLSKVHVPKGEEKEVRGILEAFDSESVTIGKERYPLDNVSYVKVYEELDF